jgi:hypothetical protein
MGRVGIRCEVDDQPYTDKDCRACAAKWGTRRDANTGEMRHCRFNYPMVMALTKPNHSRKDAGISVTMLTAPCPRQAVWKTLYPYHAYLWWMWAAWDGTQIHAGLDPFREPGTMAERRLGKVINGIRITGQFDRYIPSVGRIEDYKTKNHTDIFTKPPAEYEEQMNLYAWMIRTGCADVKTGERVQGEVREMFLYPLSHKEPGWPVPVPIWPDERVEAFVLERLQPFLGHRFDPDYLPPRSFDPKRGGLCKRCPFTTRCIEIVA